MEEAKALSLGEAGDPRSTMDPALILTPAREAA